MIFPVYGSYYLTSSKAFIPSNTVFSRDFIDSNFRLQFIPFWSIPHMPLKCMRLDPKGDDYLPTPAVKPTSHFVQACESFVFRVLSGCNRDEVVTIWEVREMLLTCMTRHLLDDACKKGKYILAQFISTQLKLLDLQIDIGSVRALASYPFAIWYRYSLW